MICYNGRRAKLLKKYLLDCHSFRLKKTDSVTEGGLSRNLSIRNYLINELGYKSFVTSGNNTLSAIQAICFFLTHRNDQIFISYPTRFFLMGGKNKANRWIGNVAIKVFLNTAKKNRIIMDISDIKYEQYIDLEIPCPDMSLIEKREMAVFSSPVDFIFASSSMRDYAIRKYGIDEKRCDVCINGGLQLDLEFDSETNSFKNELSSDYINCVYAGTLNKGRVIDKMIDCFKSLPSARLYLMGPMGEWISEYLASNDIRNVFYLGARDEKKAHQIVSFCDLGLIPYDETRLYYNIAYPTKLSFYITAGIPYLATPVKEVLMIENEKIGYTGAINDWKCIIGNLSKSEIIDMKKKVQAISDNFTWNSIMGNCYLMNC